MIKCSHFPNTKTIACIIPAFRKDNRQKEKLLAYKRFKCVFEIF